MDEASTDYHTTLVESLINVNLTEVSHVVQVRAEGPKAPSPLIIS